MTTKLIGKTYFISENTENPLIPNEARSAIISYNEQGVERVYFVPRKEMTLGTIKEEKEISRLSEELNPERSREEVVRIVNALEEALE